MSDSESEKLTGKLEQVNETALKRLQTIAARKKADAVIGVELNYTQFASYSVGTIASGTAVRLKKKPEENPVTENLCMSATTIIVWCQDRYVYGYVVLRME